MAQGLQVSKNSGTTCAQTHHDPTPVTTLDHITTASPVWEALSTTYLLWLFSSSFCGFGEIKTSQKCGQILQNWIEN